MALPAVVAVIGGLAGNEKVRAAALKVAGDVYERIISRRDPSDRRGKPSLEMAVDLLEGVATKEEMIVSFAALQAELDKRHQRTNLLLVFVLLIQAAVVGLLIFV
jgi:hypothetical protein